LIGAALNAPTGGNLQSFSILTTRSESRKRELAQLHGNQPMIRQAPLVLTYCADVSRNSRWIENQAATSGFDNLWGFLIGMSDALCAAENIVIAAQSLKLGSCYSGGTFIDPLRLIDFFNCPRGVIPVATPVIGYPDEEPSKRPKFDAAFLVHEETYQPALAAAINGRFKSREESELSFYAEFYGGPARNDFKNLAQVYAQFKYKKDVLDACSLAYLKALRKQGFLSATAALRTGAGL
jgi:nitroreductase